MWEEPVGGTPADTGAPPTMEEGLLLAGRIPTRELGRPATVQHGDRFHLHEELGEHEPS
jgi:hypothetical protein